MPLASGVRAANVTAPSVEIFGSIRFCEPSLASIEITRLPVLLVIPAVRGVIRLHCGGVLSTFTVRAIRCSCALLSRARAVIEMLEPSTFGIGIWRTKPPSESSWVGIHACRSTDSSTSGGVSSSCALPLTSIVLVVTFAMSSGAVSEMIGLPSVTHFFSLEHRCSLVQISEPHLSAGGEHPTAAASTVIATRICFCMRCLRERRTSGRRCRQRRSARGCRESPRAEGGWAA